MRKSSVAFSELNNNLLVEPFIVICVAISVENKL